MAVFKDIKNADGINTNEELVFDGLMAMAANIKPLALAADASDDAKRAHIARQLRKMAEAAMRLAEKMEA